MTYQEFESVKGEVLEYAASPAAQPPQPVFQDGRAPFTSTIGGIDPVNPTDLATKNYVDTRFKKQATAPTSPDDLDVWLRTTAPQKWFIRDAAAGRWYALEDIELWNNRNGTMAGGEWLGAHRLSALSANLRGWVRPYTIHWHTLVITSTTVPSASSSIDFSINGSDVSTVSWDGVANRITAAIDIAAAAMVPHRAQVNYSSGTAPENPQIFAYGREYV